ncbi:hypothetical protein AB0M38_13405 [Streptomyces sp. NPDC051742]|uniref:hypothetical protein n=1 Tax=Streptomyces sp. NPDC051742 TaxID=3155169 RepID=UPI00341F0BE1
MDASGQGATNGTPVVICPYNGQNTQKGGRGPTGRSTISKLVCASTRTGPAPPTMVSPVIMWTCNGQSNQQWTTLP